eukprot:4440319-Amphidinium_carterae.3
MWQETLLPEVQRVHSEQRTFKEPPSRLKGGAAMLSAVYWLFFERILERLAAEVAEKSEQDSLPPSAYAGDHPREQLQIPNALRVNAVRLHSLQSMLVHGEH